MRMSHSLRALFFARGAQNSRILLCRSEKLASRLEGRDIPNSL